MRFVGLALISALAASVLTAGCENEPPLSPGAGQTAPRPESPLPASAASQAPPGDGISAARAEITPAPMPGAPPSLAPASDAVPGVTTRAAEAAPSRVTRVALQDLEDNYLEGNYIEGNDGPLAAGNRRLTGDGLSEDRLLQDPLIGDTLIGDGEPMDDVDDAASGVVEPDPDQAGAPVEPPSFPRPASRPTAAGAGQAEPRGTASENQQR